MDEIKSKNLLVDWMRSAFYDLENIKYILDKEYLTTVISFHSQQAIEKSFKALIIYKDNHIPKTHDLIRLYNLIDNYIHLTEEEFIILERINEVYIESRYPGELGLLPDGIPSQKDAKDFYELALKIFDNITNLFSIEINDFKGGI